MIHTEPCSYQETTIHQSTLLSHPRTTGSCLRLLSHTPVCFRHRDRQSSFSNIIITIGVSGRIEPRLATRALALVGRDFLLRFLLWQCCRHAFHCLVLFAFIFPSCQSAVDTFPQDCGLVRGTVGFCFASRDKYCITI
jgi:hypothetical protein